LRQGDDDDITKVTIVPAEGKPRQAEDQKADNTNTPETLRPADDSGRGGEGDSPAGRDNPLP
ncbi:MAG: hypothetical protein J6S75_12325, partial [Thermoguttaceae bacterium]|nr:hypothetical protein [Thermoguttaceae bacterium]